MRKAQNVLIVVLIAVVAGSLTAANPSQKVLIRAAKPYTSASQAVTSLGGTVVHQFKYVDAIAAEVPQDALSALKATLGSTAVSRDDEIAAPRPIDLERAQGRRAGRGRCAQHRH